MCNKDEKILTVTEIDEAAIELKETDIKITYRLLSAGGLYFISLDTAEEHMKVYVGENENDARCLFGAFVGGLVTPCTAEDIVRDFMANKIS